MHTQDLIALVIMLYLLETFFIKGMVFIGILELDEDKYFQSIVSFKHVKTAPQLVGYISYWIIPLWPLLVVPAVRIYLKIKQIENDEQ
jgi:hypothetical protein